MSAYKLLLKSHRSEMRQENSQFIGIGYISQSLDEFNLQKDALDREFADAEHVTFAYRILHPDLQSIQTRFYDADEPAATAGKPIFMHLEGNAIINVSIFVIRYFGGIKLGAGGLVKAYGDSARLLIQEASWGPYILYHELTVTLPYSEQNRLEYLVREHGIEILDRMFGADVVCSLKIAESEVKGFRESLPNSLGDQNCCLKHLI